MAKNNQITKVVNGEIADADVINQIVENAGNEGGAIPYDPISHQRDDDGNEALGSITYPWGDLFINEDAALKEIVTSSASVNASVLFKNLRKFIYLKDAPSSFAGAGAKFVAVNAGETGLEFITSPNKSNMLFQYTGQHENQGSNAGEYTGTSLVPSGETGNYRFLQMSGSSYITKCRWKWVKIPGVTTITVHTWIWSVTGGGGEANLRINVGSATANVSGTTATHTPEYKSFTIDVSGLVDGTLYDVTADLKDTAGNIAYCSNIIAIGS